jgi:hypothetical protein
VPECRGTARFDLIEASFARLSHSPGDPPTGAEVMMSTTKPSFWSRPRGPLLLGAAACVACCTAPLAAVIIGAGAASTIAAIAEPLAGALLAAGAVLAIGLYLRRRRARAAVACSIDNSCGCSPAEKRTLYSSPEPVAEAPIACTADLRDQNAVQAGMDKYRAAFTDHVATERTATGFRWRFRSAPGLEAKLEQLATAEHACCSFMKFDVTTDDGEIVWNVSADADARSVVDQYMRLPERLQQEPRPGHDLDYLKQHAVRAGITFTSDSTR